MMLLQIAVKFNRYMLGGENVAYTAFGKAVKKRLIDLDKSCGWLCERVRAKTGRYFDDSYLSKICTGSYASPKMVAAIAEILDIPVE